MIDSPRRPRLGQWISSKDRIERVHDSDANRIWKEVGADDELKAKPVNGIYIGYRTFSNGAMAKERDLRGPIAQMEYIPAAYFEVWLIIPNARHTPVPVLPSSVLQEFYHRKNIEAVGYGC